jgi:hydrogenase maturation protein HypF
MSFEGESGMLLEELYDESIQDSYPIALYDKEIDFLPMIEDILDEKNPSVAVSKFFNTLVEIIILISSEYDLPLVLSGGVFQNRVLLKLIFEKIPEVIVANEIPPNDGGIALGQIVAR